MSEDYTAPEWRELGIPVDDDAEPDDAGPSHEHDVDGDGS